MIEPGVILMKAVRVQAFTQRPDDIGIDEVPLPEPAHGQIRVRMLMCPVHPSDFHFVRGIYYQALERVIWNQGRTAADPRVCFDPGRSNECPVPPYTLGAEGVGIVDASGGGLLAKHLVGKRVAVGGVVHQTGVWQEFAIVNARRAVAVPDSLPDEQAAMYLANPISAYVMVKEVLEGAAQQLAAGHGSWLRARQERGSNRQARGFSNHLCRAFQRQHGRARVTRR